MVPCYPFKRDAIMNRFLVVIGILMAAFCYCLGWIAFLYDKSDPDEYTVLADEPRPCFDHAPAYGFYVCI